MKKKLSFFLVCLFMLQSFSAFATSTSQNLEVLINEFQYDLSQASNEKEANELLKLHIVKIRHFMKSLDPKESELAKAELLRKTPVSFQKDYLALTQLVDFDSLSREQKEQLFLELINKSLSQGAAWNSNTWMFIGIGAASLAVLYIMADAVVCGYLTYSIFGWTYAENGCAGSDED